MKTNCMRLVVALLMVCACFNYAAAREKRAMVTGDKVNLRSAPSIKGKRLFSLYKGCMLKILETKGDWIKVDPGYGNVGYVNSGFVKVLTASPVPESLMKKEGDYEALGPCDDIRFNGWVYFEPKGDYVRITTEWMRYDPMMGGRFLPAEVYSVVAKNEGGKLVEKYFVPYDFDWEDWSNASVSVESLVKNGKLKPLGNDSWSSAKEDNEIFYYAEMKVIDVHGVAYRVE